MVLRKPLVLASRSPRRLHLLRQIGLDPLVIPCDIPEAFDSGRSAGENAEWLAVQKAEAAAPGLHDCLVLGADTIVTIDGMMLGKPQDREDAVRMLTLLSGRTHLVHTGFAVIDRPSLTLIKGVEETRVSFRGLPPDEIAAYVAGGSPMDKAGAYGIQDDYGAVFVQRVEGCFYNVVGLPLAALYAALQSLHAVQSIRPENG